MRRFHSYGPVSSEAHFCVPRSAMVDQCVDQLLGRKGEDGGHYFTIWAPRQTGKTWLMRQAMASIRRDHADQFIVATMSMQGVFIKEDDPAEAFLERIPFLFREAFGIDLPEPLQAGNP